MWMRRLKYDRRVLGLRRRDDSLHHLHIFYIERAYRITVCTGILQKSSAVYQCHIIFPPFPYSRLCFLQICFSP